MSGIGAAPRERPRRSGVGVLRQRLQLRDTRRLLLTVTSSVTQTAVDRMDHQRLLVSEPLLSDARRAKKDAKKASASEPKLRRQPAPLPPPFRRQDVHVVIDFEVTIQDPHYIPAEMAMCAFSAERGIIDTFHVMLKPKGQGHSMYLCARARVCVYVFACAFSC